MTISLRAATRGDLPEILAIYNDAVINTTASYDYEPSTLEKRTRWFEEHEAHGLRLDASTTCPGWLGERLDVGYAVDVLHPLATREATLQRAPMDRSMRSSDRPAADPGGDILHTTKLAPVDSRTWAID
jgi:hypothetical protein